MNLIKWYKTYNHRLKYADNTSTRDKVTMETGFIFYVVWKKILLKGGICLHQTWLSCSYRWFYIRVPIPIVYDSGAAGNLIICISYTGIPAKTAAGIIVVTSLFVVHVFRQDVTFVFVCKSKNLYFLKRLSTWWHDRWSQARDL